RWYFAGGGNDGGRGRWRPTAEEAGQAKDPRPGAGRDPPLSSTNHEPASSVRTSSKSNSVMRKSSRSRGSPANRVATSVVRSSDSSWKTTGTPSRVNWTSSSHASAPACQPRRAASSVFSGAWDDSPRWATITGWSRGDLKSARKRFADRLGGEPIDLLHANSGLQVRQSIV